MIEHYSASGFLVTTHENRLEVVFSISHHVFDGIPQRGHLVFTDVVHFDCDIDTAGLFADNEHSATEIQVRLIGDHGTSNTGHEDYLIVLKNGGRIRLRSKPFLLGAEDKG